MSWYNPLDDLKWALNKFGNAAGGATGNGVDSHTYAPGARFSYNPSGQLQQRLSGSPNAVSGGMVGGGGQMPLAAQTGLPDPWKIDDGMRQNLLAQQGGRAGQFADTTQQNYLGYGLQGQQALGNLAATAAGQNSVSAEQLRQGYQQGLAGQQAMVASASPQNSAMAARTGAIQAGRLGAGLAGQQAVAGLQERQQAQAQYGNLLQGLRGQDLSAATTSRQNAESGYGAGMTGAPQKTWMEQYGPAIMAGASVLSDKRTKTKIEDGTKAADSALKGLKAALYEYKDPAFGAGKRVGIMAQDLEKAGLGHAVMDAGGRKAVHSGHLAAALAAMMPGLDSRLAALEGKAKS